MNYKPILRKCQKALPYILSGLSVVGVVATAVFSAKATAKALEQVNERDDTWKCYIPTALIAIATAACIIGNGVLNRKQQASLISAYTVMATSYKRYREKTKELYGDDADKKIMSQIVVEKAKDAHIYNPGVFKSTTLDWGVDDQETQHLFYEAYGQTYFTSTINRVMQAQMAMMERLCMLQFVSVNEFYELLGLDPIHGGDEVGWAICDGYAHPEFDHYKTQVSMNDELEALVIDYMWYPETVEELGW